MRGFSLKEFLDRQFRGRRFRSRGSMPGVKHAAKYRRPCDSLSNGGESKVNGADHTASFSSSNGADFPAEFTFVPRPMEPNDLDRPVRCPPPEPCIVHDGIVFKDRLANSRRRSDLLGSMRENDHIEYYSTPPNRRRNRSSKELLQSPALIAPDLVATKIVD
ncbi:hypothetical protein M758_1G216400 [Ceratodon purpureus]|nr:hypothetical protein M758_1G216400 [Ceratodon purpureus]